MTPRFLPARVLLLFAMVLSGLAGAAPAALAQSSTTDPNAYVSELSDIEVEVSGTDFEIYEAESLTYDHGEGEYLQISSATAFIQIGFYDDTDTNLETMELLNGAFEENVDDFEVLDEEVDGEVVYTYAVGAVNDVAFLYYLSVTEDIVGNVDLVEGIYAPAETFFDDFADAQEAVTLDGDALLQSVDGADLESLAEGAVDTGTTDSGRDRGTVDDEPTEEAEEDPDRGSTRGGSTSGEVYEFELIPAELTLSGDVTLGSATVDEPVVEQIQLSNPTTGSLAIIQLLQTPMDAEASLDFFLGTFDDTLDSIENIDSDATDTSAWSLDVGEIDGQEAVIYIHVDSERYSGFHYVELLLSPEPTFLDDVSLFSQDVAIDGQGMFAASDVDLEALLTGEVTPDGPDDPDEGGSSGQRTGEKTDRGRDRSRDEGSASTPGERGDQSSGLDLESQGLVSESEFESLQHGPVVEWDEDAWSVDTEWDISAVSDEETGIDHVVLFWQDGNASMMIQIMASDGSAPADFVDLWESDDYIAESVHEDAELLLSDSGRSTGAAVYRTYDSEGGELILIQEVVDLDGGETIAVVTMFGSAEEIADAYGDAEDLVTVDGLDVVGTFTSRELEGAVAP